MIYRNDDETGPELPPELAELDAELASIQIHERPSFAPELEAELERAWARPRLGRGHRVGQAMAAAVATLMFGGLLVPQARASFARMLPWYRVEESVESPIPEPESVQATVVEPEATRVVIPNRPEPVDLPSVAFPTPDLGPELPFEFPDVAFPELIDRDAAVRAIQEHYPVSLQEQGVGGLITVRAWVSAEGVADDVQITRGAGVPELDRVALEVVPTLGFRPARRAGVPVGTWVQFDLLFEPSPEYQRPPTVEGPSSPVDGPFVRGGVRTRLPADLVLVVSANPAPSEVGRSASWVVPLSADPVEATSIGAIFELLDLPEDRVGYELQAYVENSEGWIIPLMIRPAGAEDFRASWSRLGGETRRVSEYVTVDLTGLSSGEYVLWLTATLPDSGGRAETGRMLVVR